MRVLWLLLAIAPAAHADLYRWIDPDSGSVKISSAPPTDPRVQAEIVRAPAARKPSASTPGATSAAAPSGSIPEIEARWRARLTELTAAKPEDLKKDPGSLRRQFEDYEAVRAELDRVDPAGAARRNAEAAPAMERLKQAFAAYFNRTPPAQR